MAIGEFTTQVGSNNRLIDDQVHTMKPGNVFSIWAYENPSTGYHWDFNLKKEDDPCNGYLKVLND